MNLDTPSDRAASETLSVSEWAGRKKTQIDCGKENVTKQSKTETIYNHTQDNKRVETGGNRAGDNLMTKDYVKDTQDIVKNRHQDKAERERTQQQKPQLETKIEDWTHKKTGHRDQTDTGTQLKKQKRIENNEIPQNQDTKIHGLN